MERGAYYRFYGEEEWEVVPLCYDCVDHYHNTHAWEDYEYWEDINSDRQNCFACGRKLYG